MERLRSDKQLVEMIASSPALEMRPADAYRAALSILNQELSAYEDKIWADLSPAKTRSLRAARRRLRSDILVLEALLARAIRHNL